jgi:hypothetical protein
MISFLSKQAQLISTQSLAAPILASSHQIPLMESVLEKKISDLGGMHINNKKNQGHKILRGSAKAYIHGAHPHSTHTISYKKKYNSEELYSFKFTNSY